MSATASAASPGGPPHGFVRPELLPFRVPDGLLVLFRMDPAYLLNAAEKGNGELLIPIEKADARRFGLELQKAGSLDAVG